MKRLILLAMLAPACAFGQVYKCTDAKGKVVFQETACDANVPAVFARAQAAQRLPGGARVVTAHYAVYEPRAGDDQTRTTVYYLGDVVNQVRRDVVRSP
jgi:hypothetical protein